MSTRSHFIYGEGVEAFEETSEPQSIFGKFTGFNAYLYIEKSKLKSFSLSGEYIVIHTKDTNLLPPVFKIWGDAIIELEFDGEDLCIRLKGGHHVTRDIYNQKFDIPD